MSSFQTWLYNSESLQECIAGLIKPINERCRPCILWLFLWWIQKRDHAFCQHLFEKPLNFTLVGGASRILLKQRRTWISSSLHQRFRNWAWDKRQSRWALCTCNLISLSAAVIGFRLLITFRFWSWWGSRVICMVSFSPGAGAVWIGAAGACKMSTSSHSISDSSEEEES